MARPFVDAGQNGTRAIRNIISKFVIILSTQNSLMKKKINIRIPTEDDTALREHAEEKGWSFSELLRRIIREYLERIKNGRSET
jgi:predicted DNA binding CopG/RHH family protein